MNIQLQLNYSTNFGEELVLNLISNKDAGKITPYRMKTQDGRVWTCQLKLPLKTGTYIDYFYTVVQGEDHVLASEWQVEPHRLEINATKGSNFMVFDRWLSTPEDTYQYSAAFTDCIRSRQVQIAPLSPYTVTVRIKVRAPQLRSNERLAIVGNDKGMGGWDVSKALPMYEHNYNEWVADIDASKLNGRNLEFKFITIAQKDVCNDSNIACNASNDSNNANNIASNTNKIAETQKNITPESVIWEEGYNRSLILPLLGDNGVLVYEMEQAFFQIADTKCAGTLVPVFSLRSDDSLGVGDFGDLKKMVDWVALTQQKVLQVLPINDTTTTHTWTDSYPYNAISIFALHPQYVDLTALPAIKDEKKAVHFEALRKELNALPQIDYERVNDTKTAYLQALYVQEGKQMLASAEFKAFFKENEQWLVPYAQYCYFREEYGTCDISKWTEHPVFNEADRKALSNQRSAQFKQVAFYYFVQFILDAQMSAVHDHARSKGVILKGDIPIGVNRYGCDVWQEPHLFHLNGQAGAPPDDFSVNGQNWGFPTYNWDAMIADGCKWWVRRFSNMAKYFDAYRIDHVLGFFRIWEIPIHSVHGLTGQFSPSLGMTREEIEAYGLNFQEELFTEPFIMDWVLERMFGVKAGVVRDTYLEPIGDGRYRMRPEYDTQRKIEAAFADKKGEEDCNLRDGLYALISDVLFVRDHRDPNKFHPRICVQFDYIYESLYDSDKQIFNQLYNEYYYRRNNQFWYREAMQKLPKITEATRMLVCAEDLGMVPDCVAWVMNELRILSLELQSMPKDPSVRFGIIEKNPYRSVCTISSHDMPTLRQWWDEDMNRTQDYYNQVLGMYGVAPHPLPGWLARNIIANHLACPSMLCVLSIQDWFSIDENIRLADANAERINIPANPRHYWRYRMHHSIEQLMESADFNQNIINLIREGGRM